jgi:hypothetical protein
MPPSRLRTLSSRLGALAALAACTALAGAGSAQAATTLPTISVAVTPTSITVSGALQSGGVNIVSKATGVKEASVMLALLKPGISPAALQGFMQSKQAKDINRSSEFGSIVFDGEAEAGKTNEAQTNLRPGVYVALLLGGEGPPKAFSAFTVAPAPAPAALPAPQAIERSIEFGFRGPATLHVGELVGNENEGWLVHMDAAFQVRNMRAARQAVKLLRAGNEKALGRLIIGGFSLAGPVSHGAYQQQTISAKPGVYVQVCFMETQDGRDHTRIGMERIIKVVK